jgi:hypothetical protein
MNSAMKTILTGVFIVLALSLGLGWYLDNQNQEKAKKILVQKRIEQNRLATPSASTHNIAGGQIIVLDVPYPSSVIPEWKESQKCFIWRDPTGTAISCPHQPTMTY